MTKIESVELDWCLYATFWGKLQQAKFDLVYYDLYFDNCTVISRTIKYIIIGATSLATGAWINWNSIHYVGIVCAVTIWVLQGMSALTEILPYEGRKLELREMVSELEPLYIRMEDDWRTIHSLQMTNEQIQTVILHYDQKQADIKRHYFKNDALPVSEKIRTKADELTTEYFSYFYEVEK